MKYLDGFISKRHSPAYILSLCLHIFVFIYYFPILTYSRVSSDLLWFSVGAPQSVLLFPLVIVWHVTITYIVKCLRSVCKHLYTYIHFCLFKLLVEYGWKWRIRMLNNKTLGATMQTLNQQSTLQFSEKVNRDRMKARGIKKKREKLLFE